MRTREEIHKSFNENWESKKGFLGGIAPETATALTLLDIREVLLDIRELLQTKL